jgi:glutathione S-transferase
MNPQHTVPTFVDGELILCESKAIGQYLADQYGTDDSLYPKDPTERALVNQRLFFDVTLFSTIPNFYYPMIFANQPESPQMHSTIDKNFQFFDTFLDGQDYAALGHLTIADLFLITTVSTLEIAGNEIEKYPNVNRWYQNLLTTMPGIETHLAGVEATKGLFGRKEKEEEA